MIFQTTRIGNDAVFKIGHPLGDQVIVEGSKVGGGLQTHFLLDRADPELRKKVIEPAHTIGKMRADDWVKLRELQTVVNLAVPRDGFRESREAYMHFLGAVRDRPFVSLGDYVGLGIGVCRENALLTVVAMQAAEYSARFAYFKAFNADGVYMYDHALALFELGAATYVLDSYPFLGRYFNAHRLVDLLDPPKDRGYSKAGPLARNNSSDPGGWRLCPAPFPLVYPARSCLQNHSDSSQNLP